MIYPLALKSEIYSMRGENKPMPRNTGHFNIFQTFRSSWRRVLKTRPCKHETRPPRCWEGLLRGCLCNTRLATMTRSRTLSLALVRLSHAPHPSTLRQKHNTYPVADGLHYYIGSAIKHLKYCSVCYFMPAASLQPTPRGAVKPDEYFADSSVNIENEFRTFFLQDVLEKQVCSNTVLHCWKIFRFCILKYRMYFENLQDTINSAKTE